MTLKVGDRVRVKKGIWKHVGETGELTYVGSTVARVKVDGWTSEYNFYIHKLERIEDDPVAIPEVKNTYVSKSYGALYDSNKTTIQSYLAALEKKNGE